MQKYSLTPDIIYKRGVFPGTTENSAKYSININNNSDKIKELTENIIENFDAENVNSQWISVYEILHEIIGREFDRRDKNGRDLTLNIRLLLLNDPNYNYLSGFNHYLRGECFKSTFKWIITSEYKNIPKKSIVFDLPDKAITESIPHNSLSSNNLRSIINQCKMTHTNINFMIVGMPRRAESSLHNEQLIAVGILFTLMICRKKSTVIIELPREFNSPTLLSCLYLFTEYYKNTYITYSAMTSKIFIVGKNQEKEVSDAVAAQIYPFIDKIHNDKTGNITICNISDIECYSEKTFINQLTNIFESILVHETDETKSWTTTNELKKIDYRLRIMK